MFYLNIVGVVLALILGLKDFPKLGIKGRRKLTIIIIILILIAGINFWDIVDERNKEEKNTQEKIELKQKDTELEQVDYAIKYEIQRIYLIEMGLTDSQIESLGEEPLLELYYNEGKVYERTGNFKESIESYERILKFRLSSDVNKVLAYNLVGSCYFNLYELEKSLQNFQKALDLVEKLKDEKEKSNGKMVTFYNISRVYKKLTLWKDAQKYLEYSLEESVKLGNDLREANTLLNISDISYQLNKPKIAIEKLFQSILAYQESLKAYTLTDFSLKYANTQNNLGAAYSSLAQVQDTTENCEKAIRAYQESFMVYTLTDFPLDYATTQNNLGNAYHILAQVEDKAENCNKAIQAFQEALKVYTPEDFPMNYAITQNNLGAAYSSLAEVQDKAENCEKAIQAYQEALKVYTKEKFPEEYRIIEENIKNVYEL